MADGARLYISRCRCKPKINAKESEKLIRSSPLEDPFVPIACGWLGDFFPSCQFRTTGANGYCGACQEICVYPERDHIEERPANQTRLDFRRRSAWAGDKGCRHLGRHRARPAD